MAAAAATENGSSVASAAEARTAPPAKHFTAPALAVESAKLSWTKGNLSPASSGLPTRPAVAAAGGLSSALAKKPVPAATVKRASAAEPYGAGVLLARRSRVCSLDVAAAAWLSTFDKWGIRLERDPALEVVEVFLRCDGLLPSHFVHFALGIVKGYPTAVLSRLEPWLVTLLNDGMLVCIGSVGGHEWREQMTFMA
eukprot:TRINITY_DN1641_c0_g1_i1.p2 TRINITY_DN1641_c0_g1~~TRINITY_DN1641_c0_g1_i1.p2  ORF type:complete len:197 (-),score=39.22 TRINITY_DN1641_c0_g1_i1:88-678(-)